MPEDTSRSRGAATPACPICGRPRQPDWRPFCSRRCADVDLGRWMVGSYAIPTEDRPETESEPPERSQE